MRRTWWKSGQYNALCDVCGFKFKSIDLKQRWDGLMVCHKDWEIRHPQELIRPVQDQNKLPWTRPEGTDTFVNGTRNNDASGYPGFGGGGGTGTGGSGSAITINPTTINPIVTIPVIILDSTGNIDADDNIYPVGPVIIPVVIPEGVDITTITINPLWPAGSVINIVNNHPNSLPPIATTTPTDKYTVNPWRWGAYPPPILAFNVQPTETSLYASISPSIEVWAVGNLGLLVENYTGDVTLALAQSVGTLSGTLTVAAVAGVATFSGISLDEAGVGFYLIASGSSIASTITSDTFNNVASLVFTQQPTDVDVDTSISPAVTVTVQGATSETITGFTGVIDIAIAINPGVPPGVLSGTLAQTAVAGVATFSDLQINVAADSYALVASTTEA